jgi:LCP family protein required for cell wall assembly
MTGSDGGTLGGEPGPGERAGVPPRGAGLSPDPVPRADIPGPRPGFYPAPPAPRLPASPVPPGSSPDPRQPGDTREADARRRPGPASAQRLMARISAGRKARQRRALLLVSGAMSAMVLLAAGGTWALSNYVNAHLGRINAGTAGTPSSGPLNILVAGLDERTGLTRRQQLLLHVGRSTGETNTDTLMLVHVPADHRYVKVVSLPRDSWVDIPGHGMNKINAALSFGGPALMVRTVEQDTGLEINDYVEVNFLGFVKVIDALGGVNICLPSAVNDHYSGLRLSAGVHHVSGITALEYARDRHSFAASDLARIQNQQQLISTALTEAISSGVLANPVRLERFLSAASAAIKVDQGFNVVSLADELRGVSSGQVTFTTVPLSNVNYVTPTGQSAVQWAGSAASALFTALKNDEPTPAARPRHHASQPGGRAPRRSQVSLDVYNGTLIGGLSTDTGIKLAALGFRVDRSGVDWTSHNVTQTVIQYPPGQKAAAQVAGQALPGATLQQVSGLSRLRVVLGQDNHAVTAPSSGPAGQPASGQSPGPGQQKTAAQDACRR